MKKVNILILLNLVTGFATAGERPSVAEVLMKKARLKICLSKSQQRENGRTIDYNTCKNINGDIVLVEKMEREGDHLIDYSIEQRQVKQKALIKLDSGKVVFSLEESNKKQSQKPSKNLRTSLWACRLCLLSLNIGRLLPKVREKK